MGTLVLAGRYEILEKIGDGGMAVVYKARDKQLNRFVAIKILKKEFITDQIFVENFIKEAKAAASLLHPNIVTIYDSGKDRDIYYIVMEYVEGRALSEIIATEAPFDYKRCIRIAKQVASALSLAHRNNIIHRDVKPHNILITNDGTAKITDFGIAKAVSDGTIINDSGVIMGSVHYFSPEQSRGQYVDEKSDIYSLGIVLYEMMTGRVPFDADNPVTIAVMHMNDTIIPPSRLVKGVPPGLDQIVMKATAKFQSDRFSNIDEMYKALDNVNFITGMIDDPVIAGFVKPTHMVEEEPGRGYSNQAPAEDMYAAGVYDGYKSAGEPDYRASGKNHVDEVYDTFEDEDEEEDGKRKKGGFFGFGAATAASGKGSDGDKGQGKLTRNQKIILIIAAIAVAIALSFPLSKVLVGLFATGPVEVPNVVGMTQDVATKTLTDLGFNVNVTTEALPPVTQSSLPSATEDTTQMTLSDTEPAQSSDEPTFKEGQVMEQDPVAGTMAKAGSAVNLKIAGAPEASTSDNTSTDTLTAPVEVPDLVGKTKANAEYAIKTAGFQVGNTGYDNSDLPMDTVISQVPKAGEMAPGNSKIIITISLGPKVEMATVQQLVGKTLDEANKIASDNKFKVNVSKQDYSETVNMGLIISQDPAQGSTIALNGTVNVVVSLGSKTISSIDVNGAGSVTAGKSATYTAQVNGTGDVIQDVTWSVQAGSGSLNGSTINSSGKLTVPQGETATSIKVIATSKADTSKTGSRLVTIIVPAPPAPPAPVKHSLTVINGTGSGNYAEGTQVTIATTKPDLPDGLTDDDGSWVLAWTTTGGTIAGPGDESTTIKMPNSDTTVTATWTWTPNPTPPSPSP